MTRNWYHAKKKVKLNNYCFSLIYIIHYKGFFGTHEIYKIGIEILQELVKKKSRKAQDSRKFPLFQKTSKD
jgi:hypothetical protein